MYSVTKRIDFCYGHRLLDYDGICKHPHGHNAVAEIEVQTDTLDTRNMVCDFSDIKRIVKGWIDRELDHKMLLRHDDPLVAPLKVLGEPMYLLDSNPTVERIARLIFDYASGQALPVIRVRVWETPTSFAEYKDAPALKPERALRLFVFDLDGTLVDSRRDLADAANAVLEEYGCGPLPEEAIGRMVGDGASTLVARAFSAAACPQPPDALERFLALYDLRLLNHTVPYHAVRETLAVLSGRAIVALLTNKPLHATRRILDGLDLARYFASSHLIGGDGPLPRKPDPAGLRHLMAVARCSADETILVGDSLVDWQTARAAGTQVCLARYGFGFASLPGETVSPGTMVVDSLAELGELIR